MNNYKQHVPAQARETIKTDMLVHSRHQRNLKLKAYRENDASPYMVIKAHLKISKTGHNAVIIYIFQKTPKKWELDSRFTADRQTADSLASCDFKINESGSLIEAFGHTDQGDVSFQLKRNNGSWDVSTEEQPVAQKEPQTAPQPAHEVQIPYFVATYIESELDKVPEFALTDRELTASQSRNRRRVAVYASIKNKAAEIIGARIFIYNLLPSGTWHLDGFIEVENKTPLLFEMTEDGTELLLAYRNPPERYTRHYHKPNSTWVRKYREEKPVKVNVINGEETEMEQKQPEDQPSEITANKAMNGLEVVQQLEKSIHEIMLQEAFKPTDRLTHTGLVSFIYNHKRYCAALGLEADGNAVIKASIFIYKIFEDFSWRLHDRVKVAPEYLDRLDADRGAFSVSVTSRGINIDISYKGRQDSGLHYSMSDNEWFCTADSFPGEQPETKMSEETSKPEQQPELPRPIQALHIVDEEMAIRAAMADMRMLNGDDSVSVVKVLDVAHTHVILPIRRMAIAVSMVNKTKQRIEAAIYFFEGDDCVWKYDGVVRAVPGEQAEEWTRSADICKGANLDKATVMFFRPDGGGLKLDLLERISKEDIAALSCVYFKRIDARIWVEMPDGTSVFLGEPSRYKGQGAPDQEVDLGTPDWNRLKPPVELTIPVKLRADLPKIYQVTSEQTLDETIEFAAANGMRLVYHKDNEYVFAHMDAGTDLKGSYTLVVKLKG